MKRICAFLALIAVLSAFTMQGQSNGLVLFDAPNDCIQDKCSVQLSNCIRDPKCIPAIKDCEDKCSNSSSCWEQCLHTKGDNNAVALVQCALDNCANQTKALVKSTALVLKAPEDCIQEKCPTELSNCVKDPKCINTLNDCQKKCNDNPTCWSNCLATAGNANAIALVKCAAENCANATAIDSTTALVAVDPEQCLKEKCPKEYAACEKDPKCVPALQACEKKCGSSKTCWEFCLPGKGSQAAIDAAKCGAANHCVGEEEPKQSTAVVAVDPEQCLKDKCPNQYAACEKDPKCVPALKACEQKCGSSKTCWEFCLPGKGSQAAIDAAKCGAANGCVGEEPKQSTAVVAVDPEQCLKDKCPNQYAACQKDPKCVPALQACEKKCGSSKTCWEFCLPGKGSQAAIDAAKCGAANGCVGEEPKQSTAVVAVDPEQCLKDKCPNQYAACQKDPKCVPALQACEKKCGSSKTCWEFCLPGKGSQAAIDAAKCGAANGCVGEPQVYGFEVCMSNSCSNEVQECLSDKMCRLYLLSCRNPAGIWEFDVECLQEKSAFQPKLNEWFHCGGQNKCL